MSFFTNMSKSISSTNEDEEHDLGYGPKFLSTISVNTLGPDSKSSDDTNVVEKSESISEPAKHPTLKKGLQSRHVQLIALGGAIGTGLFVGTSSSLATCGPGGLLISYIVISTVIFPIMNAFGEMVSFMPGLDGAESAGSSAHLVYKYVDKSLGFATSWNYYYCYVMLVAAECTAASGVVTYWTNVIPQAALITIFLAIIVGLNFTPVQFYGESEFWLAITKILCILGLIILSFILFWGGGPTHDRLGFRYWKDPGVFAHHLAEGCLGGFLDIYTGIIKGSFAFILGPELVCLTSSECQDQRRNISKAAGRFVYRLMFFYILGALSITVIVAYNNPTLIDSLNANKPGAGSSPFVIGIQSAGITVLPHIINLCILLSACSAGNAFMFASTRSLLTMANTGNAPKIFRKINKNGVPYMGVLASTMLASLAYLNVTASTATVFNWFSNISVVSGFIGWICASIAYIRFRKAIEYRGILDRVPFKGWGQPYLLYYSLALISIITITNGYAIFLNGHWNFADFVAAYITLPVFVALLLGHKIYSKTLFRAWWYPTQEIDVLTGLDEIELLTKELDENRKPPTNIWERFLDWLL